MYQTLRETLKAHVASYQSMLAAVLVEMLSMRLSKWLRGGLAAPLSPANTSSSSSDTPTSNLLNSAN